MGKGIRVVCTDGVRMEIFNLHVGISKIPHVIW